MRLRRHRPFAYGAVLTLFLVLAGPALAPGPDGGGAAAQIPDTFTNLQHFPEDISRDSLLSVMREFSFSLGVPCRYCHAGGPEDNQFSLQDVDFAADDKLEKRRARYMLRMVDRINGELLAGLPAGPERPAAERVRVECRTCHRRLPRPRLLVDIMAERIAEEGIDAAIAHYRDLRERLFGGGMYDFSSRYMIELANDLAAGGRAEDGIALLTMMTDYFPESSQLWLNLGDIQRVAGRRDDAVASYRRVLEFSPENAGALRRLEEMGETTTGGEDAPPV
ncbi:MAG: c-type cytochrome [Gemmatimonadota bacterium]